MVQKWPLFACLSLFLASGLRNAAAQENLYIGSGAVFYIDSNTIVSALGDVTNSHSGSSVFVGKNSEFRFYGAKWTNTASSPVTGTGKVMFIQPQPAGYSGNVNQKLAGGDAGSYFTNLYIDNTNNVDLTANYTAVHDTVKLVNGLVVLNNKDFIVGNGGPGVINGYTENRYFVTNGTAAVDSGFLVRNNIGSSSVAFPVGFASADYTPMSMVNSGTADNYKVRVFQHVYENGTSGTNHNQESIGRTWMLRENTPGGGNLNLNFQHNSSSEGPLYTAFRNQHYVSHYEGYSGANGGDTTSGTGWDLFKYSSLQAGSTPGTITTGSSISNAVVSTRNNYTDTTGLFTKTVYRIEPLPIEITNLQAVWKNQLATVKWVTQLEQNNASFDIEYSQNGTDFTLVGNVKTSAIHGNSTTPIAYEFVHKDIVKGSSNSQHYYRLKQINTDASFTYTPWVKLDDVQGISVSAYPNVTDGILYLSVKGNQRLQTDIKIFDNSGKIIFQKDLKSAGTASILEQIHLESYAAGNYQLMVTQGSETKVFRLIKI